MRRLDFVSALIGAGAFLLPVMGWAQQAMLTGDTQINSAATTTKYGASTTLNISPTNSALLQFDLADILPSGTTAAQVVKARLIVFPDAVTTGGTVNLYQVISAWTEGSVTYTTKPTIAGTAAATISIGVNNTFHDFNVTTLVQNWITTPASNFGVELQASGTTNITIDSKENANTSHSAMLEIDLSGPVGPTGPTGAIGPQGPAGPAGARGATGATGAQGPAGGLTLPFEGETSAGQGNPGFYVANLNGDGIWGVGGSAPADGSGDPGGAGLQGFGGPSAGFEPETTIGGNGVEGTGGRAAGNTDNAGSGGYFTGGAQPAAANSGGDGIYTAGGVALNGTTGVGLFAYGNPQAATFVGDVYVDGNLSKSGGSFKIDDPVDPEDKYLYHSFVESPDMKNVYDGVVVTDGGGRAIVTLPDYFESLNSDFRYQLTTIGSPAKAWIASEVANNQFTIKTDQGNIKVSWQVTGIRQDAWANAHRIPNEVEKGEKEKGHYLHPELFGHAGEPSISQIDHPVPKSRQK